MYCVVSSATVAATRLPNFQAAAVPVFGAAVVIDETNVDLQLSRTGVSPAIVLQQSQLRLVDSPASNSIALTINSGSLQLSSAIKTGAPTSGTSAEWKLGSRVAATVALDTTQYIEVDIGGTLYKLAIVT